MFKKYSSYLIVLLLGVGLGLAETGGQSLQEQFETVKQMNYLNQVGIYIVDAKTQATPRQYSMSIEQEEEKELTLLLKNEAKKEVHIRVSFADQVMENNKTKGCSVDYENGLSQFIKTPREGNVTLKPQSEILQQIKIEFPAGIKDIYKGCIAYGVIEDQDTEGRMISIITRKVLYVDFFVGGEKAIKYKTILEHITKKINNSGELEITFEMKNPGNVPSSIQIDGKISNIFGFEREIHLSEELSPENIQFYTANIGNLPFYEGLFTISAKITDTPIFRYDLRHQGIDPEIIAGSEKNIKILYFKAHWRMLIPLLLVITPIIMLYRTLRRKRKPDEKLTV